MNNTRIGKQWRGAKISSENLANIEECNLQKPLENNMNQLEEKREFTGKTTQIYNKN